MRILGISGSLRRDSHNTSLLRAAAMSLPSGVELELFDGLGDLPHYNADIDEDPAPEAVVAPARGDRRRRRRAHRHAGVQRLDPRRAQERARLGLAAVPRQRAARHARRRGRRLDRPVRRGLGAGGGPQGPRDDRRRRASTASCRSARRTSPSATTAIWPTPACATPSKGSSPCWPPGRGPRRRWRRRVGCVEPPSVRCRSRRRRCRSASAPTPGATASASCARRRAWSTSTASTAFPWTTSRPPRAWARGRSIDASATAGRCCARSSRSPSATSRTS